MAVVSVKYLRFENGLMIISRRWILNFVLVRVDKKLPIHQDLFYTPAIQGHRVKGSIYCRARCADSKKVSYVGVGPCKVVLNGQNYC